MNLQAARLIVLGGVLAVILSLVALVIVIVLRGGPGGSTGDIAGLISFVGILVALASSLLGQQATTHALNSHLESHQDQGKGQ